MVYLILLYFLGCNLRRLIFAEIIFARLTFAWIYFREFEFYHNSCVFIFGYVEIAIILRERISVVTRYLMFMPSMMITGETNFCKIAKMYQLLDSHLSKTKFFTSMIAPRIWWSFILKVHQCRFENLLYLCVHIKRIAEIFAFLILRFVKLFSGEVCKFLKM